MLLCCVSQAVNKEDVFDDKDQDEDAGNEMSARGAHPPPLGSPAGLADNSVVPLSVSSCYQALMSQMCHA